MTAVAPGSDGRSAPLDPFLELPVAAAVLDTELRFVAVNDALAMMNGFPAEHHLGRYGPDLLPEIEPAAWDAMRRVIGTGDPEAVLVRGATAARDGGAWHEQFHPWRDPVTSQIRGVIVTVIDVTEQQAVADAAQRRADQLHGIALLGSELLAVDGEGEVAEMLCRHAVLLLDADAAAVATGSRNGPVEIVATVGYPEPLAPRQQLAAGTALAHTAQTGVAQDLVEGREWEIRFPIGAAYHRQAGLRATATEALLSGDATVGALAISYVGPRHLSPTERSTLTAIAAIGGQAMERARMAEERRRTAELREAFVDVLAHELKTPLATIYGGLQMVEAHPALDPEARQDLLGDAAGEAERLVRLVDDLVVLSRLERGVELDLSEPILLSRLAERVVAAKAVKFGMEIELRLPPDPAAACGEPAYAEQVLRNLLTNARKYGRPPYEVVVTPAPTEVEVRVLDRGPGLPADAERLFALYYRGASTASRASGSGVGLFVCRELVRLMGGRTWAANRDGGGAEFGFALPLWRDADVDP